MSPALQLTRNLQAAIEAVGISNVTAHDSSESMNLPNVTVTLDSTSRNAGLPGIYDVSGRIELRTSPDDQTETQRATAQTQLWELVADIPTISARISDNLRLYIFKVEGDTITEDDPFFTYSIAFSAKVSLTPTT